MRKLVCLSYFSVVFGRTPPDANSKGHLEACVRQMSAAVSSAADRELLKLRHSNQPPDLMQEFRVLRDAMRPERQKIYTVDDPIAKAVESVGLFGDDFVRSVCDEVAGVPLLQTNAIARDAAATLMDEIRISAASEMFGEGLDQQYRWKYQAQPMNGMSALRDRAWRIERQLTDARPWQNAYAPRVPAMRDPCRIRRNRNLPGYEYCSFEDEPTRPRQSFSRQVSRSDIPKAANRIGGPLQRSQPPRTYYEVEQRPRPDSVPEVETPLDVPSSMKEPVGREGAAQNFWIQPAPDVKPAQPITDSSDQAAHESFRFSPIVTPRLSHPSSTSTVTPTSAVILTQEPPLVIPIEEPREIPKAPHPLLRQVVVPEPIEIFFEPSTTTALPALPLTDAAVIRPTPPPVTAVTEVVLTTEPIPATEQISTTEVIVIESPALPVIDEATAVTIGVTEKSELIFEEVEATPVPVVEPNEEADASAADNVLPAVQPVVEIIITNGKPEQDQGAVLVKAPVDSVPRPVAVDSDLPLVTPSPKPADLTLVERAAGSNYPRCPTMKARSVTHEGTDLMGGTSDASEGEDEELKRGTWLDRLVEVTKPYNMDQRVREEIRGSEDRETREGSSIGPPVDMRLMGPTPESEVETRHTQASDERFELRFNEEVLPPTINDDNAFLPLIRKVEVKAPNDLWRTLVHLAEEVPYDAAQSDARSQCLAQFSASVAAQISIRRGDRDLWQLGLKGDGVPLSSMLRMSASEIAQLCAEDLIDETPEALQSAAMTTTQSVLDQVRSNSLTMGCYYHIDDQYGLKTTIYDILMNDSPDRCSEAAADSADCLSEALRDAAWVLKETLKDAARPSPERAERLADTLSHSLEAKCSSEKSRRLMATPTPNLRLVTTPASLLDAWAFQHELTTIPLEHLHIIRRNEALQTILASQDMHEAQNNCAMPQQCTAPEMAMITIQLTDAFKLCLPPAAHTSLAIKVLQNGLGLDATEMLRDLERDQAPSFGQLPTGRVHAPAADESELLQPTLPPAPVSSDNMTIDGQPLRRLSEPQYPLYVVGPPPGEEAWLFGQEARQLCETLILDQAADAVRALNRENLTSAMERLLLRKQPEDAEDAELHMNVDGVLLNACHGLIPTPAKEAVRSIVRTLILGTHSKAFNAYEAIHEVDVLAAHLEGAAAEGGDSLNVQWPTVISRRNRKSSV